MKIIKTCKQKLMNHEKEAETISCILVGVIGIVLWIYILWFS